MVDTDNGNREVAILVVDDEETIRTYLQRLLSLKGYIVHEADSGAAAINFLRNRGFPTVIFLDIMMPEMDGLETLREIKGMNENVPVIMLTCLGQTSTIVEAMQLGATDYLVKTCEPEELDISITKALEKGNLLQEVEDLKKRLTNGTKEATFISVSEKMERVKEISIQVADTDVTVLVHGESGVGKEVVARFLHRKSRRSKKPFIKVNCAALPTELLESELFGYEKGAFTGAVKLKPGKFEFANKGTIFLDEIGEMSLGIQAKLLQVLQDGEFSRLGGREDVIVDVRVITATNKDLEQEVRERRFREDLFYRLNVVNIHIPPVRERPEEIPVLAKFFFQKFKRKYNKKVPDLSEDLLKRFAAYKWRGNVRELENMIKRVIVLGEESFVLHEMEQAAVDQEEDDVLDLEQLDSEEVLPLKQISKRASMNAEKKVIRKVLNQTNWNRKKTAKILQISYKALLYKIKESQIENR